MVIKITVIIVVMMIPQSKETNKYIYIKFSNKKIYLSLQCCLVLASSRWFKPWTLSMDHRHPRFAIHLPSRYLRFGKSSSLGPGSFTWSRKMILTQERSPGESRWSDAQCLQNPQSSPLAWTMSDRCLDHLDLNPTLDPVYCLLWRVHCKR